MGGRRTECFADQGRYPMVLMLSADTDDDTSYRTQDSGHEEKWQSPLGLERLFLSEPLHVPIVQDTTVGDGDECAKERRDTCQAGLFDVELVSDLVDERIRR